MKSEAKVIIYSDGACRGNPGPGGWGVLLESQGKVKKIFGGELETTNNRMELLAAIKGLEALTRPVEVALYTDSKYVIQGITEWIVGWRKKAWKNSKGKPVKNKDLWLQLDQAMQKHQVAWNWVKGHSGHPGNEEADRLANEGVDQVLDSQY